MIIKKLIFPTKFQVIIAPKKPKMNVEDDYNNKKLPESPDSFNETEDEENELKDRKISDSIIENEDQIYNRDQSIYLYKKAMNCPGCPEADLLKNAIKLDFSQYQQIKDVSMLGRVHTLDLSSCHGITNESISKLGGVHTLDLSYCPNITDVSHLGTVHTLLLNHCPFITNESVSKLGGVHHLELRYCSQITNEAIKTLGNVDTLDLHGCVRISDVSQLTGVKTLDLTETSVSNVDALANAHRLKLENCKNVSDVSKLGNVKNLDLSWCNGVKDVSMLTNVKLLDLSFCDNVSQSSINVLDGVKIKRVCRLCTFSYSFKVCPCVISKLPLEESLMSLDRDTIIQYFERSSVMKEKMLAEKENKIWTWLMIRDFYIDESAMNGNLVLSFEEYFKDVSIRCQYLKYDSNTDMWINEDYSQRLKYDSNSDMLLNEDYNTYLWLIWATKYNYIELVKIFFEKEKNYKHVVDALAISRQQNNDSSKYIMDSLLERGDGKSYFIIGKYFEIFKGDSEANELCEKYLKMAYDCGFHV